MVRIGAMRIVAALIDGIIAGVAAAVVQMVVFMVLGRGYAGMMVARLVGAAIVMGYFYLEVLKGQAAGKMIFKYQITDQNGGPASQQALMKRYLIKMSGTIFGAVAGILSFSTVLIMVTGLVSLVIGVALLVMGLMLLRANCLAYWDELCGTAVFGPGVVQAGFPVMPPPPPPTA